MRGARFREAADAEETSEEEGASTVAEEVAEEEEHTPAEEASGIQKNATMGRQLLDNQAVAPGAEADHAEANRLRCPLVWVPVAALKRLMTSTNVRSSSASSGSNIGSNRDWKSPIRRSNAMQWDYREIPEARGLVGSLCMESSAIPERERQLQMDRSRSLNSRSSQVQGVGKGRLS